MTPKSSKRIKSFSLISLFLLVIVAALIFALLQSAGTIRELQRKIVFPPLAVPGITKLHNIDSKSLIASVGEGCICVVRFSHHMDGALANSESFVLHSGTRGLSFHHLKDAGKFGFTVDGKLHSFNISTSASAATMLGNGGGKAPHWIPVWATHLPNHTEAWRIEIQWSRQIKGVGHRIGEISKETKRDRHKQPLPIRDLSGSFSSIR